MAELGDQSTISGREGADLGQYVVVLRPHFWTIMAFSIAVGAITLVILFLRPNIYRASAVIAPAPEEKFQNPAIGALATFGLQVGAATKLEDLEALFKSKDLTARVFERHNPWPIVSPENYDSKTGELRRGWIDQILRGQKAGGPPRDWDAIRLAADALSVTVNRKVGTILVSFECVSSDGSARVVQHYLEEAKSRLQEEALARATKNKKFIEEQIAKTVDALTKERLYSLLANEVEKEMLARNREQFGFLVIDSPRIPDTKVKPKRLQTVLLSTILSFIAGCAFFLYGKQAARAGTDPNHDVRL